MFVLGCYRGDTRNLLNYFNVYCRNPAYLLGTSLEEDILPWRKLMWHVNGKRLAFPKTEVAVTIDSTIFLVWNLFRIY